jgi:hypothetical protein
MKHFNKKFLLLIIFITISCEKESRYKIGQEFEGGIIFYIDASNLHGLIAAPSDQGDSIAWGCETMNLIGSDETKIGKGLQNTIDIVNGCTSPDFAARICYDLVLNGYDDWYLPSKDELNLMYLRKDIIGNFSGIHPAPYWSSSEFKNEFAAWRQDFTNGEQTIYDKYNMYHVRAMRSF